MAAPILPMNLSAPASIHSSGGIAGIQPPGTISGTLSGGQAYQNVLNDAISQVEGFQKNTQQSVDRFLNGEGEEIHKVALTAEQDSLSFDLFLQVRNKVVAAY